MSQSVRAHAHHIISVRQWPAEKKYVNFSWQGECIKKNKKKKKIIKKIKQNKKFLFVWERELIES